jgi:hypothetical protein
MEFVLLLVILFAVAFVVTAPLRRPRGQRGPGQLPGTEDGEGRGGSAAAAAAGDFERESELAELEAAREAKYREIRDTQLDFDTGKLSREDFEALDSGLRAEAFQILEQLDRLRPPAPSEGVTAGPAPSEGMTAGPRAHE